MELWELNLRDGMSQHGMNNLESWNKRLRGWVDEWKNVVEGVDGVRMAKQKMNLDEVVIEILLRESELKFEAKLEYFTEDDRFGLKLSAIESYSSKFPDFTPHTVKEKIMDIENREKGFVLQALNNRFLNFLDWFQNRESQFQKQKDS